MDEVDPAQSASAKGVYLPMCNHHLPAAAAILHCLSLPDFLLADLEKYIFPLRAPDIVRAGPQRRPLYLPIRRTAPSPNLCLMSLTISNLLAPLTTFSTSSYSRV